MAEYLVRKTGTCAKCEGKGHYYHPHCPKCGWVVTERELAILDRNKDMVCGHLVSEFAEETWCEECDGQGQVEQWVSLQDALIALGIVQPEGQ